MELPMGTQTTIGPDGSIQSNFGLKDSEVSTALEQNGELSIQMTSKDPELTDVSTKVTGLPSGSQTKISEQMDIESIFSISGNGVKGDFIEWGSIDQLVKWDRSLR